MSNDHYQLSEWAIPCQQPHINYSHTMERTSDLVLHPNVTTRYPKIKLSDIHSIHNAMHFREYRVFQCKGRFKSILIEHYESHNGHWKKKENSLLNNANNGNNNEDILEDLVQLKEKILITFESIQENESNPKSKGHSSSGRVVFDLAPMRPTESMPRRVPAALYQHMAAKRQDQFNLSSTMDAVVSCFTSGKDGTDPVRNYKIWY